MKAIILAAGAGRRLGLDGPKSMAPIAGTSIIHRQLHAFGSAGVDQFVIVVGYQHEKLREHLAEQSAACTYIFNQDYATTNTIYSLYLARQHFEGGAFYANADVVFDHRLPQRLSDAQGAGALAVNVGTCGEEEVKVIVHQDRILQIGKQLDPAQCLGEFVGVARFAPQIAGPFIDSLADLVEKQGVIDDYLELALHRICAQQVLKVVNVSDLPCMEIDFPEDLEKAHTQISRQLSR